MASLSFKNPLTGNTHSIGGTEEQKAASSEAHGLFSVQGGGQGNQWMLSFLNGEMEGTTTETSLLEYAKGGETTSIGSNTLSADHGVSMDTHLVKREDQNGTTTGFGNLEIAYEDDEEVEGGTFSGLTASTSAMEQDLPGGHIELLGTSGQIGSTHGDDGSLHQGIDAEATGLSVRTEKGEVDLLDLGIHSGTTELNGSSELDVAGNAGVFHAATDDGRTVDLLGGKVDGFGGTGGIGIELGPVIANYTQTTQGADAAGNDASITGDVSLDAVVGAELNWGKRDDDGVSEYGGMVHGGSIGDIGAVISKEDRDGDGTEELTGAEVGFGPGKVGVVVSDADNDGQQDLDVSGKAGPVTLETSSESGSSFVDASKNFAVGAGQTLVSGAKAAWDSFGGLFGKK